MVDRFKHATIRWGLMALAMLIASPAWSRPAFGEKRANRRDVITNPRLKKARRRMLRKRVGLDEAKALKVEAIFRSAATERKALQKRVRAARQKLAELLRANSSDQKAFKAALDELHASRRALDALRDKQFAAVGKELTPKQQAKLLRVLAKLRKKMRRRRGRAGKGRGFGRRKRGGPGPRQRPRRGPDRRAPVF